MAVAIGFELYKIGKTAVDRLIHIINVCPTLAPQAYQLAIKEVQQGRDTSVYQALVHAYDVAVKSLPEGTIPPHSELGEIDKTWLESTNAKNAAEKSKLEVELKTYTSNLIRESIRVSNDSSNICCLS